jgi:DNA-binding CsgD family transcriptional regulator
MTSLLPALALRSAWNGEFARAYELLTDTAERQDSVERRALRAAETSLYAMAAGFQPEGDAAMREAEAALGRAPATGRTIRADILVALADMVRGRWTQAHRLLADAEQALKPNMIRLRALCAAVRAVYRVELQQEERSSFDAAAQQLKTHYYGGFARLIERLPFATTSEHAFGALTPAEREILQMLAAGASTKQVAAETGRSPHTVDTHIRSMCRKLGCSGRREAVALATSQGWVHA